MSYLNLMGNKLKAREVNDALTELNALSPETPTTVNATDVNYNNGTSHLLATNAQTAIDEIAPSLTAMGTSYNNTSSGLNANNVQSAIDEINTILGTHVTLLGNKALTGGTWITETLGADINNYRYLAFTLGLSDNGADQSGFNVIIPTSAFKLSTTSSPVAVVHDYLTSADSKSCLVSYDTDTTIRIYKGADIGSYRFSVFGIM